MKAPRPCRAVPLLAACCVAGACGSGPNVAQGFSDVPLLTLLSASGTLRLEVFSDPQPPVRGNVAVRYRISDLSSQPVNGLTLRVVPWMPAMGHGTSVVPSVSATGAGLYDLSNVYLFMPGDWQLRTAISGAATDSATPELMVQ